MKAWSLPKPAVLGWREKRSNPERGFAFAEAVIHRADLADPTMQIGLFRIYRPDVPVVGRFFKTGML